MKTSLKHGRLLLAFALAGTLSGGEEKQDLTYGVAGGEELKLDLVVPEGEGPFPVCILVHGGGFERGDKQQQPKHWFQPLREAGYAWVTINYRLAPAHQYPASVEDLKTAIRWVKTHATAHRIDPNRIVLIGESAGAYLTSIVGARNEAETRVAAVVSFYGPSDLIVRFDATKDNPSQSFANYFGVTEDTPAARALLVDASPVTHVRPGLPPFLLLHGDEDARVPYEQSVIFYERLKAQDLPVKFVTVKGGGHGIGGWGRMGSDYAEQMIAWLDETLNSQGPTE